MSNDNEPQKNFLSDSTILKRMYALKELVRRHRIGKTDLEENIIEIYAKVLEATESELPKSASEIYDDVTFSVKKHMAEAVLATIEDIDIKFSPEFIAMADSDKLKKYKDLVKKIKQNPVKKAKKSKQYPDEERQFVEELKKEAIHQTNNSIAFKNLSPEEKAKQVKAIEQAKHVSAKMSNDLKCVLEFDGVKVTTIINRNKNYGIAPGAPKVSLSQGRQLSDKVALAILDSKKKTTYRSEEAFEEEQTQKDKKQSKKDEKKAVEKSIEDNKMTFEAKDLLKEIILTLDSEEFYKVICDHEKCKKMASGLRLDKTKCDLQKELCEEVIWEENVWSLYKTNNEETGLSKNYNACSYYEGLARNVRKDHEVNEIVFQYMVKGIDNGTSYKDVINEISGTQLPQDIAKEMFLKSVFHYGMGNMGGDGFTEEKFDRMNKVLGNFGYRIGLRQIKPDTVCSGMPGKISADILKDMHEGGCKEAKNKEIAFLAKLGKYLQDNNQETLYSKIKPDLYKDFESLMVKKSDRGNASDQWYAFVDNKHNIELAQTVYTHLKKEARSTEQYRQWIDDLSEGKSMSGVEQSAHHIIERRYGGLFKNNRELFNNSDNVVMAVCFHPADDDPHKKAHLFDSKAEYLSYSFRGYNRGGIGSVGSRSILCIPQTEMRGEDNVFRPIIKEGSLLITSKGCLVADAQKLTPNTSQSLHKMSDEKLIENIKSGRDPKGPEGR